MTAQQLRTARLLWPENLTDTELSDEITRLMADPDHYPISLRMVLGEQAYRRRVNAYGKSS